MNKVIYSEFEGSDGDGALVILNDKCIYHEDNEPEHHQIFTAKCVARNISNALGIGLIILKLDRQSLPEDWNFDDVLKETLNQLPTNLDIYNP